MADKEEAQTPTVQATADEEPKLTLNIKSTKRKDSVEVPGDCTVRQVRLSFLTSASVHWSIVSKDVTSL